MRTFLGSPKSPVKSGYIWVGWPGREVGPDLRPGGRRGDAGTSSRPSRSTSRPRTPRGSTRGSATGRSGPCSTTSPAKVSFDESLWGTYERVNGVFCDAVLEVAEPGDSVWVHDYHLLLLPAMLRARRPDLKVGFFLHIPFPSYELFRLLPDRWRTGAAGGDARGRPGRVPHPRLHPALPQVGPPDPEPRARDGPGAAGRPRRPRPTRSRWGSSSTPSRSGPPRRGPSPAATSSATAAERLLGHPLDRPAGLLQGDRQPAPGLPRLPGGQPRLAGPGRPGDGRGAVEDRRRRLPADEGRHRRAGRLDQRRLRPARLDADPLPVPLVPAGGAGPALQRQRGDARHPARGTG